MLEQREHFALQLIVNDQRHWIHISRYDYLFTVSKHCCPIYGEVFGEGFTLEDAMKMFLHQWAEWNESGPY